MPGLGVVGAVRRVNSFERVLPENAERLAALGLVCLYVAIMSGHPHSIDGLLMYRQALSIAYNHSLHFGTPILWGGTATTSKFGLGLSLLYLPGVVLWSWLIPWVPESNGNPFNWSLYYQDPLYTVACAPVHVLIVAASAYLVARFIRELGCDRGIALWGLALYGLGSPALVYARGDFSQPLAGLCWIASLYAALRFRRTGRKSDLWLCAGSLGYAVITRPVEGSLLLPVALVMIAPQLRVWKWPRPTWSAVGVVTAGYLAGVAVTLLVDWGRYGSPFISGYGAESWTNPLGIGLAGALVSPGRGILWEFPAVVLLPLGVWQLWRADRRRVALSLGGLIILQLLNVATWDVWWGGWNWGLRLFVPALPLVAVLAAIGICSLRASLRLWLPTLLLAGGVVWAIPCVVTDLLNAYGGAYSSSAASFSWSAYPPIGAWKYFHHWRALAPIDTGSADIMWLRVARFTGNASLFPPAVLLITALGLTARALAIPIRLGHTSISPQLRLTRPTADVFADPYANPRPEVVRQPVVTAANADNSGSKHTAEHVANRSGKRSGNEPPGGARAATRQRRRR